MTDAQQPHAQFQPLHDDTYTPLTATSLDEALDLLRLAKVDLVVVALQERAELATRLFEQAKVLHPHCVTLYMAPALPETVTGEGRDLPPSDFFLRRPFAHEDLRQVLAQALEKQRLVEELAALRGHSPGPQPPMPTPPGGELSLARIGQILRDFAKAFSTNFDLQGSLTLFLDAINAFLRPSRLSILVRNPVTRVFEIRAHHGLVPQVAEQLRLRDEDGLPLWLMTEARILQRAEVESALHVPANLEIHREMQALRTVASMPLMASGKLVGILNVGERVTGVPYTDDELDLLFSLANHVAISIQDITLYQEVQSQKSFTEKILRYMSSGVITIDAHENIRICNHRAAEIFGKTWSEVLHADLRSLPSPLGDMLYETLRDGSSYDKHEVVVTADKRPLEVSTYQVLDEQLRVAGSVMVFQDLTSQKQLYEERRRANQLDFLNKVAGRMAHEIKNPLVSIRTFVELLDEHYADEDYREQFSTIVSQDIHTINVITEKLVSFASNISYNFEYGCINNILQILEMTLKFDKRSSLIHYIDDPMYNSENTGTSQIELICDDNLPYVKFDVEQLHKAIMYIVIFLIQISDSNKKILYHRKKNKSKNSICEDVWIYITLTG